MHLICYGSGMTFVLYDSCRSSASLKVVGFDKLNEVITVNEWMNEKSKCLIEGVQG